MKGRAVVHGAATIINAIATGKGAAFGVDLRMEAEVELIEGSSEIHVTMECESDRRTTVVEQAVRDVLSRYAKEGCGARVVTRSQIPVARGLKSSSAVANAVVSATLAALDRVEDDLTVLSMGVDASLKAGVTVTGALDDAGASYLGGVVVTDNTARRILARGAVSEDLHVLVHVPRRKLYTGSVDRARLRRLRPFVDEAFNLALRGTYWEALTINGLIYSAALGFSAKPAMLALQEGAVAAGLSGTGPANVAICQRENVDRILEAWSGLRGRVIHTKPNNHKAEVARTW